MLSDFSFKLPKTDLNKRWVLMEEPKNILDIVETRKKEFEKLQSSY